MKDLKHLYPVEYDLISNGLGNQKLTDILPRLNQIHKTTEEYWVKYLKMIPNQHVKYLIIAEAPPFSSNGKIQYVFNPDSDPRSLLRPICQAFFGEPVYKNIGLPKTLKKLANEGFLLLDSTPFPLNYRTVRSRSWYNQLIRSTSQTYVTKKLNQNSITFDENIKIAFTVKRNAIQVMEGLGGELRLPGLPQQLNLNQHQIAINGAGYPDGKKLGTIFNS